MKGFGSIESVLVAIQEDARAEVEKIESDAEAAIARVREADACAPVILADADIRLAAARRRAHERLAAEDWADRQAALDARESWTLRVSAEGQRRLRALDPEAARRDRRRLAVEAVSRIDGDRVAVLVAPGDVSPADASFGPDLEAACGKTVVVTPSAEVTCGGCVARSLDGRLRYDNTYAARTRRFESEWRAALGELFEHGTVLAEARAPEVARP